MSSLSIVTFAVLTAFASASVYGTWSGPFYTDIPGVGMGSYTFSTPLQCKQQCENTDGCEAAQFCQYGDMNSCYYTYGGGNKNCFLYDNQQDTGAQLTAPASVGSFVLWKFTEGGGGDDWLGPFMSDIPGVGLAQYHFTEGWSGTLKGQCKAKCDEIDECQAAQFCQNGDSCYYVYNGQQYNCFLYSNQQDTAPQLQGQGNSGPFVLYKYAGGAGGSVGHWSPPMCVDIAGTGLGGSYENSLQECKQRCMDSYSCVAAQFSQFSTYANSCNAGSYNGCNCYLYDNELNMQAVSSAIRGFRLYKYNRDGCGSSCCPDATDKPWFGSCDCGGNGCCNDGYTPKLNGYDQCTCNNRRLEAVEKDTKAGVVTV